MTHRRERAGPARVHVLLAGLLAALALLALARGGLLNGVTGGGHGGASDDAASPGGIGVRDAALRRTATAWLLDARVDIELPAAIRAGLDSGVPLEFVATVSLRERLPLRPDRHLLDAERRYRLAYYELTRHYRVLALDGETGGGASGGAGNYRSLRTALEGLGRLRGEPLVPAGDADTGIGPDGRPSEGSGPLLARLTLRLDTRALPLPLQSPFGSAWRLPDGTHEWTPSAAELALAASRESRT